MEPLAQFLDHFLQPFVEQLDSYVKYTTDFIRQVEHLALLGRWNISEQAVMVTMDITSLYSNVPHEEGRGVT